MRKLKKVIYASSAMREEDFSALFQNAAKIPGQQAQKYNRLMIKGFVKNGVFVDVLSAPPVTRSNCAKRVLSLGTRKAENARWHYIPTILVPRVKHLTVMLLAFLHTFFSAIFTPSAVVCDVLNISVSLGAVSAGRLLGKPCVGIVTDVPELMVTGHTDGMLKFIRKIMDQCTEYVFLTEAMNTRLNPKNKPYTIVEGVCDEDLDYSITSDEKKGKSCLYAGLLDAEYGVKDMVEAFLRADIPDCTMHICGNGPYADELKEIVSKHHQIVYHGSLLNKDVIALEKEVSLLINPRSSAGEFTKFSFPSKNMEYMTSGTPVLANRLPGVPTEYYRYIYTFPGESVEEMAETMKAVFAEPQSELTQKGLDAYRFVTEHKSSAVQAKRVLDLIFE